MNLFSYRVFRLSSDANHARHLSLKTAGFYTASFTKRLLYVSTLFIVFIFYCQALLSQTNSQYNFIPSDLKGVELESPTSLQFGPDNRLYVSQQNGIIKIFTIKRNAPNDYVVTATETIDIINQIPNHNDDGTVAPQITKRQVAGILVKGTPAQPLLYVTSSDSRTGAPGDDFNIDNNSSIISLLTKAGSVWQKVDLVRGLPRSEENHAAFGMQLDNTTNVMYVVVGGLTNAGSPSHNFAYATEFALSACILSVNLNVINALPVKGSGNTAYKYDIPTVDDPTRANNPDGSDINDPFGGNDGLNQAKIVPGGPVQVYASGFRNPFDLVLTVTAGKANRLYTIDNGSNQGWGGYPANEGSNGTVTNNYVVGEPGSTGPGVNDPTVNNLDALHYVGNTTTYQTGSYYGGHPNPIRANPAGAGLYTHNGITGVWRTAKTGPNPLPADWPPLPVNMARPIEGDFQMPGVTNSALITFATSTNGLAEYTASNFNNALKGNLLAADLNFGKIFNLTFTADGTNVTNIKTTSQKLYDDVPFASGFGTEPLDITAQGDSAIFPGTVWTCTYKTQDITIFEPQDFLNCTGLYNGEDDDSDGYTNADEKDNATNPCSAASKPNDFDHDQLSDINDPDDDNDGIGDNTDYFSIEATNGLLTRPAITYNLFNNDPGTGFFGLGFTGLMCNRLPANDYLKNFDEDSLIAGGAVGAFSIVATTQGDALGSLNNQENAFQFGVRPEAGTGPFTINGRISGPFFNNRLPVGSQSQGIYIGTGDQSNYIKITLNGNAGAVGIQVVHEAGDVPVIQQFTFSGSTTSTSVNFLFTVNPVNGTVQPKYAVNGGVAVNLGSPLVLSGALLSAIQGPSALAVGVISTARGGGSFVATWDYMYVTFDPIVATGAWQIVAPVSGVPIAREGNGYVDAGNKFYLIGGRNVDSVQMYDAANKTWQNKAKPPMELIDFQAVVHEGLVYVAGAFTGAFPRETPVSQVYIFNPLTDKWFAGSTIPMARRRGSAGTVVYKNKIYVIGGIQDGHWTGTVSWFDEYDPVTNTWKTMPDAPRTRDHFHATIINDKLYLAGGRRSSGSTGQPYSLTVPEIDVFDFNSGLWSTLPSSSNLPTPRAGAATAVLGNELLVIGGESTQATANIETEAFNLETNTWRRLADLQQRRHGTQVVKSNNGLYLVAGAGNQGSGNLLATQEAFYLFNPTVPNGALLTQSQLTPLPNLSFGSLPVNMDSTKVITLNNTGGNQAILISSVNITGASSFSSTTPFPLPFVLAAGKSINISVKFKPTVSGTQTATLVINHSGQGGNTSTSLSGAGNTPVYLINAGGAQVNTTIGMFAPDAYYSPVPGNTGSVTSPISGTTNDAIYQTERFNSNGSFSYAFPVSNGQYIVILHFAEIFFTTPGSRIFDVTLEGAKVLDNFDIVRKVGAFSATTESFVVTVSDGNLNLSLSSLAIDGGTNSPKISAIEIQRASNQAPASNAGPDKTITLPVSTTSLNGSGTDADGSVIGFSWSQVSGPNTAVLSNSSDSMPVVSGLISGTYMFSLVVTDNLGTASPADQVMITVSSAPNQVPVADAGADKTLVLPANSTGLNGSGVDIDGTITGYSWNQVSGPSNAGFSSKIVATPSVSGLIAGTYVFNLIVTDNKGGQSAPDQVSIVVNPAVNQLPVANAGPDKTVTLPSSSTTLTGTGTDADGTIATFSWSQVSGPNTAIFNNKTTEAPMVSGLTAGTYVFSLIVTDNQGASSVGDQVTITVGATTNQAPVANAGADKAIALPVNSTTLNGSGTDADGTVTGFGWSQVSGPNTATFNSTTIAAPVVSGLAAGTYVFSLTVTDNQGTVSATDQIMVIVNPATNQLPVANAGVDKTITLPANSTSLTGSGTDADGTIASFNWSQVSGPSTATFSSVTVAVPTVSGLITGTYVFSLIVTDNLGASSIADQVMVTVNSTTNQVPVANAGADKTITLPVNSTTLSGSGTDADGTITGYAWNQVGGPNTAVFSSKTVAAPTVSSLVAGTYVFSLAVTDNQGVPGATDSVIVIVNPGVNQIPVANAGADKSIMLPVNNTGLAGSGTDADGTIAGYTWGQVSGPNTASFSSKIEAAPTVSGLVAGTYVFSLTVTDNQGAVSAADQVVVSVNAVSNQMPVANAGADKTIISPIDTVVLTGLGTDIDGTISLYNWNQVSGPNTAAFSSTLVAAPKVSGLVLGTYVFRLVVTDNMGAVSAADLVNVVVSSSGSGNQPPVANAGTDKSVTLPANSTGLTGSGTDGDGTVTGYSWSQVSGPNTATFSSGTIAAPTVSGLVAGTYVFSLVVTDNLGAVSAADLVNVVVSSSGSGNQPPVANAGTDKSVTLPANSTGLTGSGTDGDGTVTGYSWSQVSGPNTATFSSGTIAAPTVSGLVAGTYVFSLVVTDNLGAVSAADLVNVVVSSGSGSVTALYRVNAGGGQVTNSIGTFAADAFYTPVPGNTHSTTAAIAGTTDDAIYQSERFNGSGAFSYAFPLTNGQYTVILHFAEISFTGVNNRVFDVTLEGTKVLDNYDIVRKAGAFTATTETFGVTVTDGTLNLYLSSLVIDGGTNSPKISAIEVLSSSGSANQSPVANAGTDKSVTLPANSTGLTGSGTDGDGTVTGYSWSQVSGPNTATFSSGTIAAPTVSGLVAGTYVFSLVVTDNLGAVSAADLVNVVVSSGSGSVTALYRVNAGGGQVTNSIGTFAADAFYTPVPGNTHSTTAAIAGTTDDAIYQSERFNGSGAFSYAFPLTNGQYTVILHFAEISFTGVNNRVFDVTLEGTKVLDNYDIVRKAGAFTATTETFGVTVTDGTLNLYLSSLAIDGGTNSPKISAIEVLSSSGSANQSPVANAGTDKSVTLPANSTGLTGSGTDGDGTVTGYSWSQVSGPNTATFSSSTIAAPTVSGLVAGTYVFSLVVTDNLGAVSAADQVNVVVSPSGSGNQPPVANAGIDKSVTLPVNSTSLTGSGTDGDGTVTGYSWSQVSGPNTATFSSGTIAAPTVSGLVAGTYVFSLVVTDNLGAVSAADLVNVVVSSGSGSVTALYRVNAGGGQVTNSIGTFAADAFYTPVPGNTHSTTAAIAGTTDDAIYQSERFNGSGAFSYAFPLTNGQYTVILHFAEISFTGVNNRVFDVTLEGTKVLDNYDIVRKAGAFTATTETFGVTVTDGTLNLYLSSLAIDGGTNSPKISAIEVLSSSGSANQSPVANAGTDKSVTLPANSTGLTGSGTDGDGTVTGYSWSQVSGPNTATFSSSTIAAPTVSGLVAGTYVFSLVVTDNLGAVSTADLVNVVVSSGSGSVTALYRVNAGGGQVTNSIGTFAADAFYTPVPGNTHSTTAAIAGTTDDAIYQSERFNGSGAFSYAFPLTNGQYTVILHFAEISFTGVNNRVFDVTLEGTKVLDNYDIVRKAGAFTATTETFGVTVTDGTLNLYLSSLAIDGGTNSPKISAIEILSGSGQSMAASIFSGNRLRVSSATDQDATGDKLSVRLLPNPSAYQFTVNITSSSDHPVSMRIFNALGVLIENRNKISANGTIRLGNNYLPGLYFAELRQGNQKVRIKFIKLSP